MHRAQSDGQGYEVNEEQMLVSARRGGTAGSANNRSKARVETIVYIHTYHPARRIPPTITSGLGISTTGVATRMETRFNVERVIRRTLFD